MAQEETGEIFNEKLITPVSEKSTKKEERSFRELFELQNNSLTQSLCVLLQSCHRRVNTAV